MSEKWKAGDWAMVQVGKDAQHEHREETCVWLAAGSQWRQVRIPADCLRPLPAGMSAEERAVLEAAVAVADWRKSLWGHPIQEVAPHGRLVSAVDAYRKTLTPPDPVDVAMAAWMRVQDGLDVAPCERAGVSECWKSEKGCHCRRGMEAALAAVEAARKVAK